MQGKIFEYNANTQSGLIIDVYHNTYRFEMGEYKAPSDPVVGSEVSFVSDGSVASDIHVIDSPSVPKKKISNSSKVAMIVTAILGIGGFAAIMVYSELERKSIKETQSRYHQQIDTIEASLQEGKCEDAHREYEKARMTRQTVDEQGLYYSIEPFAIQAHAIDIASCFAQNDDYENAIKILDAEVVHNADYMRKASEIYWKTGEKEKAKEIKSQADQFDHNH